MTVEELQSEYEKVRVETHNRMCMAILSYDDPNYEVISQQVWDLMERCATLEKMLSERKSE